jgi:hypothetical protein
VKHKKRINHVSSEVCSDKSFRSRHLGIKMKAPAIVIARCLCGPPKTCRRSSSKKRKGVDDGTSYAIVCLEKTRCLESSKRKHKSIEAISDGELQAATGLTGLSRKKMKKSMKNIGAVEVRRVPAALDDLVEGPRKDFIFCLWPDFRFNVHRHCTPGSENDFVDVETFLDDISEVQKEVVTSAVAATVEAAEARPSGRQDEASSEFAKELELTIHQGEDPIQDVPLIQTREDVPEGQDPSHSVAAFNESFGTSHRGELLSVDYEVAGIGDGASRVLTLRKSPTLITETREGALEQTLHSLRQTPHDLGKQPCTSSKKSSTSLNRTSASSGKKLPLKILVRKVCYFSWSLSLKTS